MKIEIGKHYYDRYGEIWTIEGIEDFPAGRQYVCTNRRGTVSQESRWGFIRPARRPYPESMPDPPDGMVLLGWGQDFEAVNKFDGALLEVACTDTPHWKIITDLYGKINDIVYAALDDSDIARVSGVIERAEQKIKQLNQSTCKGVTISSIENYYKFRSMQWPEGKQALDFAVTEMGEAMDAYIRTNQTGWKRNNPDKDANIGWELADVYQMIAIAAHEFTGKTLDELLREKWASKGFEA